MSNKKLRYNKLVKSQKYWFDTLYYNYKKTNLDENDIFTWEVSNPEDSQAEELILIQFIDCQYDSKSFDCFKINPFRLIIDRPKIFGFEFIFVCYARDKNKITIKGKCSTCLNEIYNPYFNNKRKLSQCKHCYSMKESCDNGIVKTYIHKYVKQFLKYIISVKPTL